MIAGNLRRLGRFFPGLATLLQYRRGHLQYDLVAGLSVAAVALPVGIAYADIARVPAVIGIYSAIFPLFAYALFGSSRQLMTGPDAATCIMVAASLGPLAAGDPQRYLSLLVVLTLLTGLFHLIAGVARLGFVANFLSQPILVGYLNGIALIIVIGQLPKLFSYTSEASDFFPKVAEFVERFGAAHVPTLVLGSASLAVLVLLRLWAPKLPSALIVAVLGMGAVASLGLQEQGVAVLGPVPSALPSLRLPTVDLGVLRELLRDAAGIMLISFTSGVLTAKSFARRNRYDIDANQELTAFGACNLASGLAQGFPVTGADSRTAVNNAMGGRTQLVGIVAAGVMLLFLLFFTGPLANLPLAALAAIIIVSAVGLFDLAAVLELRVASKAELLTSVGTTFGVLILGVLPGVLLAVILSIIRLLSVASRPRDAILGYAEAEGIRSFHSTADFPEATTIPGLLIYRFESSIVFFNADYFKERVLAAVEGAKVPAEWVVIDASPINIIDFTGLQKAEELREEIAARGVSLYFAHARRSLDQFFNPTWIAQKRELGRASTFPTLQAAVHAFMSRSSAVTPSPTPLKAADAGGTAG